MRRAIGVEKLTLDNHGLRQLLQPDINQRTGSKSRPVACLVIRIPRPGVPPGLGRQRDQRGVAVLRGVRPARFASLRAMLSSSSRNTSSPDTIYPAAHDATAANGIKQRHANTITIPFTRFVKSDHCSTRKARMSRTDAGNHGNVLSAMIA